MLSKKSTYIPIRRHLMLLHTYLQPQWRSAFLLTFSLLLGIGLQLSSPQILRSFIDSAYLHGVSLSLVFSGLLFILATLMNQGASMATSYLSTNIAWTATNKLREDLVAHCLSLDMSFHTAHTPSEMIERIDGDVADLSNFFSQFVLTLLTSALLQLSILILFFTISWIIGVAILLFSLLVFVIMLAFRRWSLPFWLAERQISTTFYSFLGERLEGIEDIHANGAIPYTLYRFLLLLRSWFPIRKRASLVGAFMWIATLFLFQCGNALALSLGLSLSLSPGTIYLLFAYTGLLIQPIQQMQTQLQDWQQAEACISRIEELLSITSSLPDGKRLLLSSGQAPSVSFTHVTFGYVAHRLAIDNITFSVPSGRVLGILGHTGSGKTTIARLLFRLYDPQAGEVAINKIPLQQLQLHDLRRHMSMITQDARFFQATVRDNLTFFNRTISDEQIIIAIEEVGLAHWYKTLPTGLDTILGARGKGLSAGEAQLLVLTRVFLTNARLVILDEATARLDPATEVLIEQAMRKLLIGRTAIIIAHRLTTIQCADDIAIIEDGRLVEYGQRVHLTSDPHSRLVSLLQTGQLLEEKTYK